MAGENLALPVLGPLLQHAGNPTSLILRTNELTFVGAMWIRRSFGEDSMYVTLVQAYIDTLLAKGLNLECFIGTSSVVLSICVDFHF